MLVVNRTAVISTSTDMPSSLLLLEYNAVSGEEVVSDTQNTRCEYCGVKAKKDNGCCVRCGAPERQK